ncbi:hypothetical protein K469DRAFT_683881 [Zopfia rhizophila CBS 207.26]|uniref:Uncharacterized protein n=1 Tax=Zopfia rhizophila CBS 207.26 TaxID=1314779 RepID=A0A6A6D8Q8_9PEZI|nr:hypothetical protein K469DRAFT_683881 [Zopfia rhizophila CBS 207.26]
MPFPPYYQTQHPLQQSLAQALTTTPKALSALAQSKLSAFRVAQLPEQQFVENFGDALGSQGIARDIHNHAVQVTTRNDVLTSILQIVRGTGIAAINGTEPLNERFNRLIVGASELPEQINLEEQPRLLRVQRLHFAHQPCRLFRGAASVSQKQQLEPKHALMPMD